MDANLSWIKAYVPDLNASDQEILDALLFPEPRARDSIALIKT
jgi:hypothetical protein